MSIPETELNKLQNLTNRIYRLRTLLGDQHSLPHLIQRKKGHYPAVFRRRVKDLQKLEVQRTRLLESLVDGVGDEDELDAFDD